ncbi:MAG TPA: SOS response-associated peptidase family protein [Chitinophagaceae bacterium]|nr:SOS response-associated peptidase family protein [Chitinophagaceae bacterium]
MCYDVSFSTDIRVLGDYFPGLVFDDQIELEFGAIDHVQGVGVFGKYPIIYINREDLRWHCRLMEWGIIPFYSKTEPTLVARNGFLNIRAERIWDDPKSYWFKIKNRRCLIPVTGIYEHRAIRGWKKKVPYWVKPREQTTFFLPGLYSVTELPDKETGEMIKRWSYGLITRAANSVMSNIHNDGDNRGRMPLFLPLETAKEFLSEALSEQRYREILAYEMPSEDLDYHPVFTIRTPKLRPDDKPKTEFWDWEHLPALGEMNP